MNDGETSETALPKIILYVTGAVVLVTLVVGIVAVFQPARSPDGPADDEFIRLSNTGKNLVEQGNAEKAAEAFEQAVTLRPSDTNALINAAIACLMSSQAEKSAEYAERALAIRHDSGAALYVAGCAHLRLGHLTNAVQLLQQAKQIDRTVNAVSFQLGRAYQQLNRPNEALEQFQEVVQFDPVHPAAHYALSQVLRGLGRTEEAQEALRQHQELNQGEGSQISDPFAFEKCQYTKVQVPFKLEQPDPEGIQVTFTDVTADAFASRAESYRGPVAVLDLQHDGWPELFVREGSNGFRLCFNSNGVFQASPDLWLSATNGPYHQSLVGDMNNDGTENVVVLGEQGSHLFKFTTNGVITDLSQFSRARTISAQRGLLADLDFTGKLDLLSWGDSPFPLTTHRNLGQPYFIDASTNSGLPLTLTGVQQVVCDDWNGDDLLDLVMAVEGQAPQMYVMERGGQFVATNLFSQWPAATALALADLDNDGTADLVLGHDQTLSIVWNGGTEPVSWDLPQESISAIHTVDYDNDGWLDLLLLGRGTTLWRNTGQTGFKNVTASTGLSAWSSEASRDASLADFDLDGDTDVLLTMADGQLMLLRNDGGNANQQLKIHLVGRKSNASGLGIELEVLAGGLRVHRRVSSLPVEIGVGRNTRIDSLTAHWFDFDVGTSDVEVEPTRPLTFIELQIRDGSCPYLYTWDGQRFRFVTDVLGAAPLGLPISEDRLVDSYPFEFIRLGDARDVGLKNGHVEVRLTEELREVLYLDEATLAVVDKAPDTEVHSTSKLVPAPPFPKTELITLHRRQELQSAETALGENVLAALSRIDDQFVSPNKLRPSQWRGLAEPHAVIFETNPLEPNRPWVLALTGWLRYGGGMANMAASHDPDLPFPFPHLDVFDPEQQSWQRVEVTVGAPAGNTKTIVADLQGKLPPLSRRFRLSTSFEIHWDRIAFFEKQLNPATHVTLVPPSTTDLRWRGYSEYRPLPWNHPLTPDYDKVHSLPPWRITPSGWATRYGSVTDLVSQADNALALVCGGDELAIAFDTSSLPPLPPGQRREYFLYLVGWDKDADFHVVQGHQIEPLPWHGMEDQSYGQTDRPYFENDGWMERYNTRWVGPRPVARAPSRE